MVRDLCFQVLETSAIGVREGGIRSSADPWWGLYHMEEEHPGPQWTGQANRIGRVPIFPVNK
jgi:hypothetical protein